MTAQIAKLLKRCRKEKNLTLQEVATRSGLSISYISLLERGLNSPTIENLNKLCFALDITLTSLIDKVSDAPSIVVKKDERQLLFEGPGYRCEAANAEDMKMNCVVMTILDNQLHVTTPHVADEAGYVVKGSLSITVSGTNYHICEGDCIYIEANREHSYQKTSEEECVIFWTYAGSKHIVFDDE